MDQITSKNQILEFCGGLIITLVVGGCGTLSPAPPPANVEAAPAEEVSAESPEPAADVAALQVENIPQEPTAAKSDAAFPVIEQPPRYADLWDRIRAGFSMEKLDSPRIARHERWFANNSEYMQRMLGRARLYLHYIVQEVEERGMPLEIALLPAVESAYKPNAYSRARASGLWQFIPSTGRLYGLKINWWYDGRRDIEASTDAALDYLEKLYSDFDGDWHLALAAYNAGEGRVMRAVDYNQRRGRGTRFSDLTRLKSETKNYVPKLMAMINIVSDPAKYGIQLEPIPNTQYFTKVDIGSQVDLNVVAQLADLDVNELARINPGFSRWATDPDGPHYLLVPVDKKDALIDGLDNLPDEDRIQWRRHAVRRGDTLSEIARRYGVSVGAIRRANHLRSNLIRAGQSLLIPISTRRRTIRPPLPVSPTRSPVRTQSQPILHRVRSGETLWGIARRYNVLIHQIAEWNLINPNDFLRLGQRLKIWTSGSPAAHYRDVTLARDAAS